MVFNATVKEMLDAQKDDRAEIRIETSELVSVHKATRMKFDGSGIRLYKSHTDAKGKVNEYDQGRINHINLDDPCQFMLTSKSWFYHGNGNLTITVK